MAFETYTGAFERAVAHLVSAFGESPDAYFTQPDLVTALYLHLFQSGLLKPLYATRDGRRTPLVHQQYAASSSLDRELDGCPTRAEYYDLVLFNPSYVRSLELDRVARREPLRATRRWTNPGEPLPLLAAANLVVVDRLSSSNMDLIEQRFYTLVHAEQDALRAYLGVFLRQWELDDEAQRGVQVIESWAKQQPYVSVCYVQSYRDRAGHVFAGRYLNEWLQEAPLLPMEFPLVRQTRAVPIARKSQAARMMPTVEQIL